MTNFIEVKYARPYPAARFGYLLGTKMFYAKDNEDDLKVLQKAIRFAKRQEHLTGYKSCLVRYTQTAVGFSAVNRPPNGV